MLYRLHQLLPALFYPLVSILFWRDWDRETLLLRRQLLILHRRLERKPVSRRVQKAMLLRVQQPSKRPLASALLIFRTDTLLHWDRELVRRPWTLRQNRRPGSPSRPDSSAFGAAS